MTRALPLQIAHVARRATTHLENMSPTNCTVTTDRRRFDRRAVHAFLSQTYWSPGIPLAVVEKAVENPLAFGVLLGEQQIGFARVVTDNATFAYLADVHIEEAHFGFEELTNASRMMESRQRSLAAHVDR